MEIRPIKTEEDYKAALAQIEPLMDAAPGSDEEARLEVLGALVIQYEKEHFDMRPPSLAAAIQYHMESRGLTREEMLAAIREATGAGTSPEPAQAALPQRRPGLRKRCETE